MIKKIIATALLVLSMGALALGQTGVKPCITFLETDQTLPAGLWRICLNGDIFTIERNTAAGNNFSTSTISASFSVAGALTLVDDLNISAGVAYFTEVNDGNSGTSDTIDWSTGNKHRSTLTDNVTYTFTDPPGPTNLILFLKQDGGGGNTVTWPASVKWAGGSAPVITSAASSEDIISFYFNGTNYYGAEVQNLQ